MTNLVSVVIPVFNAAEHLVGARERLAALTAPSGWELEFIVIDDHSSDETLAIVSSWVPTFPRLSVLIANGRGVSDARNQALAHCHGDFVWFTDADDDWSPRIVEELLLSAIEHSADLVVCNAVRVLPDGRRELITDAASSGVFDGREALLRLFSGAMQGHLWNKLFRRASLPADMFPPTRAHSDLGGVLRVAASFNTVVAVPESLYAYEIHAGSILNSSSYRWADLPDCLALAKTAAANAFGHEPPELLLFKYRNVVIPVANEHIRRRTDETRAQLRSALGSPRQLVSLSDLAQLLALRQPALAAKVLLLKSAPSLYAAVYSAARATRRPEVTPGR